MDGPALWRSPPGTAFARRISLVEGQRSQSFTLAMTLHDISGNHEMALTAIEPHAIGGLMQTLYEVVMIWLICNELVVLALIERRS
jgi:hypothetical protein